MCGHFHLLLKMGEERDVSSIDGIINAYYEVVSGPAVRTGLMLHGIVFLHHPEAWVAIAGKDETGTPFVDVMTLADYHGNNAPRTENFYERETDRIVSRSGNMAHVWSSYESSLTEGGEPFTSGVNTITLFHDGERWWIMGWMFDGSAGVVD